MGILPYAQGQLTSQSKVRSGRISNSNEMLWVSLPVRMKKIQSKMNALEWSQHYSLIFRGQLTPKLVMKSCQKSNSSKLLSLVLLPARMKKINIERKALEWLHHFSHNKYMGIFPYAQGQLTQSPWSDLNFKPI